jgi:hypothetical protein
MRAVVKIAGCSPERKFRPQPEKIACRPATGKNQDSIVRPMAKLADFLFSGCRFPPDPPGPLMDSHHGLNTMIEVD